MKDERLKCEVCGMICTVDTLCGCAECDLICCGQPMKNIGKKRRVAAKKTHVRSRKRK